MKIEQDKTEFKPITIILETQEEADAFWDLTESIVVSDTRGDVRVMAMTISNWFSGISNSTKDVGVTI